MDSKGDCNTGIRCVICGFAPAMEAISTVNPASMNPIGRISMNFFRKRHIEKVESQAIIIITE